MKKTFMVVLIVIILGLGATVYMNAYIRAEDKIEYTAVSENGDKELLEGLKLHTFRYGLPNDDWITCWDAVTEFENGITTQTEKVIKKVEKSHYWITERDIRYLEDASRVRNYFYWINGEMGKEEIDSNYLNAMDINGNNNIKLWKGSPAILGNEAFFVWQSGKLYRFSQEYDPDNGYFTYETVGEYDGRIYGARLSDDDSVIVYKLTKETGEYIYVMDAKTGKILAEHFICGPEADEHGIFFDWETEDYMFINIRYVNADEDEDDSLVLDEYYVDMGDILVIDRKDNYSICDEFRDLKTANNMYCDVSYTYNSANRRLAVLKEYQDFGEDDKYLTVEVHENTTGRTYKCELDSNLKDWDVIEKDEYDIEDIGMEECRLSY